MPSSTIVDDTKREPRYLSLREAIDMALETIEKNPSERGETGIVNLLRVPGEKQIMLKVTVAEVNRTAARWLCQSQGSKNQFHPQDAGPSLLGTPGVHSQQSTNLFWGIDDGRFPLAIHVLRRLNLAHVLAEPKLGVFNGQAARFRMGGEVPVPVPAGLGRTDYQSEPFGLELKCVASIIEKDRIRLDFESANSVLYLASGTNIHGTVVPGREVQSIHTAVEMRAGQTFVMSHALPCASASESAASTLFPTSNFGESNLVVLVTPEFMHPMDPGETAPAAKSKKVAELMAKFHAAYKEGKYVEAEACAAQVLKLDPDNVAAAAAIKMARTQPHIREGVSCHSVTPGNNQRTLEDNLSTLTTVKFANATLEQLVDDLRAQYGINIEFDKQAIEKCGIHLTRPFLSCNLEQVSLKSVLNFLLRQSGLTYVIKDEVVFVTTDDAAKAKPITKCYSVADLITPIVDRTKDPREKKEETPEKSLMKLIVNTVAPASWSDMGGCATMEYYPLGNTLVINQTPEVHEQISDLLAFLQAHVTYVCKDYVPLGCLPFDTPETDQASGHREARNRVKGNWQPIRKMLLSRSVKWSSTSMRPGSPVI